MIKISRYTELDMEIYKDKNVIIYGLSKDATLIYDVFTHLGIKVLGIYDLCMINKFKHTIEKKV